MDDKELSKFREEIDNVDKEMVKLLEKRMKISEKIAQCKKEHNLPVLDMERERLKINALADSAEEDMKSYTRILYSTLASMSKEYQRKINMDSSKYYNMFDKAIKKTNRVFPENTTVACQGREGTNGQMACDKFFGMPVILYFKNYEGVFDAVKNGLCKYGIVPLENSGSGSLNKIYDLLLRYDMHIVRSTKIKLDYNLAAKQNINRHEIKEIISTEEAKSNCETFLRGLENVKYTFCENSALAAKMVKESSSRGVVAITSYHCAAMYDLEIIEKSIQLDAQRHADYICITKNLEIYPGADKTSLIFVIANKPGELYKIMAKFFVLDINLIKVESRKIAARDFEMLIYIDFQASIYDDSFKLMMSEAADLGGEMHYLGSYMEIQ